MLIHAGQPPAISIPAVVASAETEAKRAFTRADFARFAPKTAHDMLLQVPGFTIRSASGGRGLGEASENVLINGERVTNKGGGAVAELQRLSAATVERIEVADAAILQVSGLSGPVANVIMKPSAGGTGQFKWRPQVRPHYSHPNLLDAAISYSGRTGKLDYTLSIDNSAANREAFGGEILLLDRSLRLTEERMEIATEDLDQPSFTAQLRYGLPKQGAANLMLNYEPYWFDSESDERRIRVDGDHRTRRTVQIQRGYEFDLSGDLELALGNGQLKLIGLRHFEHEPTETIQITHFDSGAPSEGSRFRRIAMIGETIGRAEYHWKSGPGRWQLSLERAFNRLEQIGERQRLSAEGDFVPVPYPEANGIVQEVRYEAIGTMKRPMTGKMDVQLTLGAEFSQLARIDGNLPPRTFFRPKGSLSLLWRPGAGWDIPIKLRRRIGQISFYDFLAQPILGDDRENSANPDLVPQQSWEVEFEVGKNFGRWGETRTRFYAHRIEDIVDFIPVGSSGEAIGNLNRAKRIGAESTSTILLDPAGWPGAKLNLTIGLEKTSVRDPLTLMRRPISGAQDRWVAGAFRHDVARTNIAWGFNLAYAHVSPRYYSTEIYRSWRGPWFADAFVEHKNVMGLTVAIVVDNIINARRRVERTFFSGRRDLGQVEGYQSNDQLIGPTFRVTVRGNF